MLNCVIIFFTSFCLLTSTTDGSSKDTKIDNDFLFSKEHPNSPASAAAALDRCEYLTLRLGSELADVFNAPGMDIPATERIYQDFLVKNLGFTPWIAEGIKGKTTSGQNARDLHHASGLIDTSLSDSPYKVLEDKWIYMFEGWGGPCGQNAMTCRLSGYGEKDYDEYLWGSKGPWMTGEVGIEDHSMEMNACIHKMNRITVNAARAYGFAILDRGEIEHRLVYKSFQSPYRNIIPNDIHLPQPGQNIIATSLLYLYTCLESHGLSRSQNKTTTTTTSTSTTTSSASTTAMSNKYPILLNGSRDSAALLEGGNAFFNPV
eukprot:scaffold4347_cov269-Ochromonas_danica.AAC.9